MDNNREKDFSRRDFLKKIGKGTMALGMASMIPQLAKTAMASERDYILIGHPTSLTGALAGLGHRQSG